tara:strand:+ start:4202 stop:5314 length:1113 start_codon:yes stop_codon:yes gene_type:complete
MLEASILPGMLMSVSLLLFHLLSTRELNKFKYFILIIASGLLSYVFNSSAVYLLISMCLLFFLIICDDVSTDSVVSYAVLISSFMAGNWLHPGLVEVLLIFILFGLFVAEKQKDALKLMPLLAVLLSLVALCGIYQEKNSELLLVTCAVVSTFYYGIFWLFSKRGNALANASIFVTAGFIKFFLDLHIIDLTTKHVGIITNLTTILLVFTNLFVIYRGINSRSYWQALFLLVVLNFSFTTTGLYVDMSFELNQILAVLVVFMGCGLLYPISQNPKKRDHAISLLIGVIILVSQLFYLKTQMMSLPVLLILILNFTAQMYFLIKLVQNCSDLGQVIVKTGERLPQFIYIGGVFGAIASLWYILTYVRQIQG